MAAELLLASAPLFDRTPPRRAFAPPLLRKAAARRRDSALPWRVPSPAARWPVIGIALVCCATGTPAASAQDAAHDVAAAMREAERRFRLPEAWIRAVMRAESGGRAKAVSPAGALGLMQVMPQTYAELRVRYHLGADPLQPRDNILAGAAYLREMLDRFGAPGFLAAYNAGPARYARHLATGAPLPDETQRYVAALAPHIGVGSPAVVPPPPGLFVARTPDARAQLFVARGAKVGAP